jgi:hypothetical protein
VTETDNRQGPERVVWRGQGEEGGKAHSPDAFNFLKNSSTKRWEGNHHRDLDPSLRYMTLKNINSLSLDLTPHRLK